MKKRRIYVRLCSVKGKAYKMAQNIFNMTDTKINSIKINSLTETNDNCSENQYKRQWKLKIIHYVK